MSALQVLTALRTLEIPGLNEPDNLAAFCEDPNAIFARFVRDTLGNLGDDSRLRETLKVSRDRLGF